MSACFGWILDPRLHLALIVLLFAWLAPRPEPSPAPAPDSPFNAATVVTVLDGSKGWVGEPVPAGGESLTMAEGPAEGRPIAP